MSERYKKLTSHGAISIPVAMRRDIGLQGGDPMQVSQGGRQDYHRVICSTLCFLWEYRKREEN